MAAEKYREWSRTLLCKPKDNLVTEGLLRAQRVVMVTTLEKDVCHYQFISISFSDKTLSISFSTLSPNLYQCHFYWAGNMHACG